MIKDPVRWVRTHAVGLHEDLELSFGEEIGDRENVVVITTGEGGQVGFVEFGQDDSGRYLPTRSESCSGSGLDDFT